jgi:hypothetical protein
MTAASSEGDRFARARVEFVEAMAAGCTIVELRRRKAEARAALRHRAQAEVAGHTDDLMSGESRQRDFRSWDAPWMGRN